MSNPKLLTNGLEEGSPHLNQHEPDCRFTGSHETVSRRRVLAAGGSVVASTAAVVQGQIAGQAPHPKDPLHYWGLLELAERLRKREVSPVEVTNAQLARIALLEPKLMAFDTITADLAIAQARVAEQEIKAGRYLGPLHGVPIAVKDVFFTNGVPHERWTEGIRNSCSDIRCYGGGASLKAGAVLLGKLSMAEGAGGGYHRDFRVPRNPWAANRWPGVSSSGSGVATAAGLCYASLATDTGGSIRQPSAANGVVGLKPTWGRVSRHGTLDFAPSLDHVGPMARRVADVAAVLGIIAGYDPADPTSLSSPVPDYLAEISKGLKGVRVGFDESLCDSGDCPSYGRCGPSGVACSRKAGCASRTGANAGF